MTLAIHTLDEAARQLRKSRRWLLDWLRSHPADSAGVPFYSPMGRTKTFDDADIALGETCSLEQRAGRAAR